MVLPAEKVRFWCSVPRQTSSIGVPFQRAFESMGLVYGGSGSWLNTPMVRLIMVSNTGHGGVRRHTTADDHIGIVLHPRTSFHFTGEQAGTAVAECLFCQAGITSSILPSYRLGVKTAFG